MAGLAETGTHNTCSAFKDRESAIGLHPDEKDLAGLIGGEDQTHIGILSQVVNNREPFNSSVGGFWSVISQQ